MSRAFRFGVNMTAGTDRTGWTAKCQRAEELGFDVLLVPDHLGMPAPFPSLMFAAEATKSIRLGTFVLNACFYNPVLLARDVAALDQLAPGRVEIGVGAGYVKAEFDEAGLPYPTPGERVAHLARTVDQLAQLSVPILVGGNGDKVLRLAATRADVVAFAGLKSSPTDGQLSAITASEIEERVAFARAAADGRDYESNLLVQMVIVTDDRRAAAESLKEQYGFSMSVDELLEWPGYLSGSHEEIAAQLVAHRERFGITYFTVLEPWMEAFAPVIKLLDQ